MKKSLLIFASFLLCFVSCKKNEDVVYYGETSAAALSMSIKGTGTLDFNCSDNIVKAVAIGEANGMTNSLYARGSFKGNPNKAGIIEILITEGSEDGNSWSSLGKTVEIPLTINNDMTIRINLSKISKLHPLLKTFSKNTIVLSKKE